MTKITRVTTHMAEIKNVKMYLKWSEVRNSLFFLLFKLILWCLKRKKLFLYLGKPSLPLFISSKSHKIKPIYSIFVTFCSFSCISGVSFETVIWVEWSFSRLKIRVGISRKYLVVISRFYEPIPKAVILP